MARSMKEFSIGPQSRLAKKKAFFAKITDGRVWELKRGVDFDCTIKGMKQKLRWAATRRTMKVDIRTEGDVIQVLFLPKGTSA